MPFVYKYKEGIRSMEVTSKERFEMKFAKFVAQSRGALILSS